MPPGGVYTDEYVRAPGPNIFQLAGQPQSLPAVPLKCACTDCIGASCAERYWVSADAGKSCPLPKMSDNQTFHKPICRSIADSSYGYTGWLKSGEFFDSCTGYTFDVEYAQYSLWCPEGEPRTVSEFQKGLPARALSWVWHPTPLCLTTIECHYQPRLCSETSIACPVPCCPEHSNLPYPFELPYRAWAKHSCRQACLKRAVRGRARQHHLF